MVGVVGSSPIAPTNIGTRQLLRLNDFPGFSFCDRSLGNASGERIRVCRGTISAHCYGQTRAVLGGETVSLGGNTLLDATKTVLDDHASRAGLKAPRRTLARYADRI